MGVGVGVLIALVKQRDSDMTGPLRGITWGALGYVCFSATVGYVSYMIIAFTHGAETPGILFNQWEWIQFVSSVSPLDSPWLMSVYAFSVPCSSAIGIYGILSLGRFRRAYTGFPSEHSPLRGGVEPSGQE